MEINDVLGLAEEGFHRIVYSEWGVKNTTRPIICVHGLSRNRHDFDTLADYLSKRGRHLFCPDVVGRGDSDWLKKPEHYTYEQYLADMNALIARTQEKSFDWIGTSMGGLIGMVLASLPQTPIRALVLNDIGPHIPAREMIRIGKYAGKSPTFSSLDEAFQYFKSNYTEFGDLSDQEWRTFTENSIREVSKNKWVAKLDPNIQVAHPKKSTLAWQVIMHPQKAMKGTLFDVNLWHIWEKVTCPVLLIRGSRSNMLPLSVVTQMQATHPQLQMIEVPNAGHAPMLLQEKYLEMIYQWLEKYR